MNNIIDDIRDKIAAQYKPDKLVLFGSSVARGLEKANDLDLCVIKDDIVDKSDEFIKIRKILGRTILPLDILIFKKDEFDRRRNIWGTVQYEIETKGKVLYERGA